MTQVSALAYTMLLIALVVSIMISNENVKIGYLITSWYKKRVEIKVKYGVHLVGLSRN